MCNLAQKQGDELTEVFHSKSGKSIYGYPIRLSSRQGPTTGLKRTDLGPISTAEKGTHSI